MYDAIFLEGKKIPTVPLINRGFYHDARSAASSKGMPNLRYILEDVPCESNIPAEVEAGIGAAIDDIITALTQPLTEEERAPKLKEVEQLPRIVFKGSLSEVNQFYYRRGWADGLPVIPPTDRAVEEMLTCTDLPPEHIVAEIIPRRGKATIEKIAINAVMAGALPVHMPVLIAAVQALVEPKAKFGTFGVSTGSFAPCWIINGPIRHEINVNYSSGIFSPGKIANAAIGRAMGMIIRNIGGIRQGIEDMGVIGNPGKYSMVIGENEEESPWEPLHVEHGFNKEDNTVTIFFPQAHEQVLPYATDDRGLLSAVIYNIPPWRRGLFCLVLNPANAKMLASKGWTKKQMRAFISEYARVPAYRHSIYWGRSGEITPKERIPMNPMDSMSILNEPDWIRVLVAGGPGNFFQMLMGEGPAPFSWVTKKIELPANWDEIVRKYKKIVPVYAQY